MQTFADGVYSRTITDSDRLYLNVYISSARITAKGFKLTRPGMSVGRYKMVKVFHKSAKADPKRYVYTVYIVFAIQFTLSCGKLTR